MNDWQLLQDYTEHGSESAFRTLVSRHLGLVHSAALRQVNNPALAEEICQAVFILLARKARQLSPPTVLAGWLFQTTRFVAARTLRAEMRRQRREQETLDMQELSLPDETWRRIAPVLDEGLDRLAVAERNAVLLRFFEDKNHEQVGVALGITGEAAKKRVNRALEKLRTFFARRGFTVPATVLAATLAAHGASAAPLALEISVAAGALTGAQAASASLPAVARATLEAWRLAKLKLAAGFGATAVGLALLLNLVVPDEKPPDPLALLKTVAQARQRILSGKLEIEVAEYQFGRPFDSTNRIRLLAVFEGENHRRFESFGREYSYVLMGPQAGAVTDAKQKELKLDRDGAVQAGLLSGFESHHVLVYDGKMVMDYRDRDSQPNETTLHDLKGGYPGFVFDPRCLGLWTWLTLDRTIANCLRYEGAKSIRLVGRESVDGVAAWHVVVKSQFDESLDYWIDAARPQRLLKHAYGRSTATSKFDPAHPEDPIPIEVTILDYNGRPTPVSEERLVRGKTEYNVPVDPASWTLAGLNMAVGTELVDYRISKSIGYWDGARVTPNLPAGANQTGKRRKLPTAAQLQALIDQDPASSYAREAANWIILETPDGPDVEKAAGIIRGHHLQSSNLVELCEGLRRVHPRCATNLLRSILASNPSPGVQAHACLALAGYLNRQANDTGDQPVAAEARYLLERVTTEYGNVQWENQKIANRAEAELSDLRRIGVGQMAPEIVGENLEGQSMKLADYRGNVVVLEFWATWCGPCMARVPDERKMVERWAGKPFALIGVNSDRDRARAKAAIEKERMTWPSFRDGDRGPIAKGWSVQSWPTTYVIDRRGVIRFKNLTGPALDRVVEQLLEEAE